MATRKICQSSYNFLKHSLPCFLDGYFIFSSLSSNHPHTSPFPIELHRKMEAVRKELLFLYHQVYRLPVWVPASSTFPPIRDEEGFVLFPEAKSSTCILDFNTFLLPRTRSCTKPFLIPWGFVPQPDHSRWPEHDGVTCVFEKMFLLDSKSHFSYCLSCLLPFPPITSS